MDDEYNNITDIISLCGGGLSAVLYSTGILYGFHKLGKIIDTKSCDKSVFYNNMVFCASSGGVVPLLLLNICIDNKLYCERDDWFEYYIIKPIEKLDVSVLLKIFPTSLIQSFLIYNRIPSSIINELSVFIKKEFAAILPAELLNSMPLVFRKNKFSYFNFNYINDTSFTDSAELSNDFSYLNNLTLTHQIVEICMTCCIPIHISYLKTGITKDAALSISNEILDIKKYKNAQNVYYYTLNAYDSNTNNLHQENIFNISNFTKQLNSINDFKFINMLKSSNQQINFNIISIPNKYSPMCKYNNKIYTELVPYIFFENDFSFLTKFTGAYSNGTKKLVFLFGLYETLYILDDNIKYQTVLDNLDESYKNTLNNPYHEYFICVNNLLNQLTKPIVF
jgi:hypothetical protein